MLVHGAFADASGWAGVITRLKAAGIPVFAPANPLRGVSADAAYIASAANEVGGPANAVVVTREGHLTAASGAAPDAARVL